MRKNSNSKYRHAFLLVLPLSLAGCGRNEIEIIPFSSIINHPVDYVTAIDVRRSPYASDTRYIDTGDYDAFFNYVDIGYYKKEYEVLSYNYVDFMFELSFKGGNFHYERMEIDVLTNRHLYIEHRIKSGLTGEWINTIDCYISAEPVSELFVTETNCFFWCHLI